MSFYLAFVFYPSESTNWIVGNKLSSVQYAVGSFYEPLVVPVMHVYYLVHGIHCYVLTSIIMISQCMATCSDHLWF